MMVMVMQMRRTQMKTSQGWSPDMLVGLLEALGLLLVSRFFLFFVVVINLSFIQGMLLSIFQLWIIHTHLALQPGKDQGCQRAAFPRGDRTMTSKQQHIT